MEFNATFLVSIISFITFTYLMNKVFYKPVQKIILERENFIENTLEIAKTSKEQAEQILEEKQAKLSIASSECKDLIAKQVESASLDARNELTSAKMKSFEEITMQKSELQKQAFNSKEELNKAVNEIAQIITTKILG